MSGTDRASRRIRAVVQYDGTGLAGFQRQPGRRTVQGLLEARLERLCGEPVRVVGAGRTDAGVHALRQVIHFDTTGSIPVSRLAAAFNRGAPQGLVVRLAEETSPDFHARFSAVSRTYRYLLATGTPGPVEQRFCLPVEGLLPDADRRMERALQPLVGRRDFGPFAARDASERSTVRTLYGAEVRAEGAFLSVGLTADAFLQNMVRVVVGQLLRIGSGCVEPEALVRALEAGERLPGAATAPGRGLTLVSIEYPDGFGSGIAAGDLAAFAAALSPPPGDERRNTKSDEDLYREAG